MDKSISASEVIEKMIKSKDYDAAIKVLKQEILDTFIKKLNSNNKSTNIITLLNTSEGKLSKKDYTLLQKYYYLTTEDNCAEYELYELMNIYSDLKEVRKNDI